MKKLEIVVLTPGEIRRLRERMGLTQRDLASEIGRARRTVQDWERGLYSPSDYRTIHRLGVALGMVEDREIQKGRP